jgi:hypothetical protein
MEFKGSGFKYFFNNESKTIEEIKNLVDNTTTVSIKGLDVFYNSLKTNKTEDLLKEAEQHQENNGGRADLEFLVDDITTGFSFYPKHSKIFTYNSKYLNDKNLNLEEVTKIITEERNIDNLNKVEGIKETEGKLDYELDWEFVQQMAERMSQNKGKYDPYNWKKIMDVEKLKQSLFRHTIEIMKGNYSDDGRELGHLESLADNAMMINYQLKNNKK